MQRKLDARLAKTLRKMRLAAGLSLTAIEKQTGISEERLHQFELQRLRPNKAEKALLCRTICETLALKLKVSNPEIAPTGSSNEDVIRALESMGDLDIAELMPPLELPELPPF